ncbi:hypothetical protein HYU07_04315 [Candidatus Woesearchaeota archaeon]|nr:hypothetical protein [Candidatus Woesearchaeota archaeon]
MSEQDKRECPECGGRDLKRKHAGSSFLGSIPIVNLVVGEDYYYYVCQDCGWKSKTF